MKRFRSLCPPKASLGRRDLLIGGAALAVSGCGRDDKLTASTTPQLDMKRLNREVAVLAARAGPGVLGVGLTNLESGEHFTFSGERRFPMQSVFKLLLAAAVLGEVDAKRMNLDERFLLEAEQLSPPHSPISQAWPARRDFTARELLVASVSDSDNTAADVLMKRIGGPGAVTAWLVSKKFEDLRVDRYERELQPEVYGMASFRPGWRLPQDFATARAAVPPERRLAAMRAYLRDPRDTATPRDMLTFLTQLNANELLSPASTRLLLEILFAAPARADRLKLGMPEGTRFAHKTGTSGTDQGLNLAYNDVGIAILSDGRPYGIAAFLTGATASDEARADLMADLGRILIHSVG